MSEVDASILVELAVFLAPVQLLTLGIVLVVALGAVLAVALGAVLVVARGAVLAGLELATNMEWVVVASIVAFHRHNSCCTFLEFD